MSIETVYLVVSADKSTRLVKRPRFHRGEVAFRLRITFPDTWERVIGNLDIDIPDPSPTDLQYEPVEIEEEDDDGG